MIPSAITRGGTYPSIYNPLCNIPYTRILTSGVRVTFLPLKLWACKSTFVLFLKTFSKALTIMIDHRCGLIFMHHLQRRARGHFCIHPGPQKPCNEPQTHCSQKDTKENKMSSCIWGSKLSCLWWDGILLTSHHVGTQQALEYTLINVPVCLIAQLKSISLNYDSHFPFQPFWRVLFMNQMRRLIALLF